MATKKKPRRKLNMVLPKKKTKFKYRSSKTGRFVTEAFAKRHPATTEKEKI